MFMFKWVRRLIFLAILLVVAVVAAAYFGVNWAVKRAVAYEGTQQLGVPVTVDGVSVGWTTGGIGFKEVDLGSPAGFTAPKMFTVGSLSVATTGITHLRDRPVHVTDIEVDAPHLVIEQKGSKFNFKELLNNLPGKTAGGESQPSPATADKNPTKLVIDKLAINNPTVEIIPDASGTLDSVAGNALGGLGTLGKQASALADKQLDRSVKPMTVTMASLTLTNIGNADGRGQGVEVKDVAAAVVQAMVAEAIKQNNLPIPPAVLQGNLASVKDKVGDAVKQQLQGKFPGGAGKLLDNVFGGNKKADGQ